MTRTIRNRLSRNQARQQPITTTTRSNRPNHSNSLSTTISLKHTRTRQLHRHNMNPTLIQINDHLRRSRRINKSRFRTLVPCSKVQGVNRSHQRARIQPTKHFGQPNHETTDGQSNTHIPNYNRQLRPHSPGIPNRQITEPNDGDGLKRSIDAGQPNHQLQSDTALVTHDDANAH